MALSARVLVVDDEERFRKTMCKLLTARGLTARAAGSGPEALEILRGEHFDVVILDVRMPGMTGVQALAEVRKIDPEIEAIFLTGYASLDTAREITKLGAFDYLLKPYSVDELMEKIEGACDRKAARVKLTGRD
jgi:DNA-binding NtrC family response regulator